MSKAYCIKNDVQSEATTSEEMRLFCQRPGKTNDKGEIEYTTEQQWKNQCDVIIL